MHIEPGIVSDAKIVLSYATAIAACGLGLKHVAADARHAGLPAMVGRAVATTSLVFVFFEVFPHYPVGVSEVHLILGSTLMLLFGTGAAAIGLALGLLIQGIFFAPFDLPQYGMNVTTLLVPLFAIDAVARRIIAPDTAYVDLAYRQVLAISATYQGGVVAWVGLWAIYGHGFTNETLVGVTTFGAVYLTVILIEPVVDLAVLTAAKALRESRNGGVFHHRLHAPGR